MPNVRRHAYARGKCKKEVRIIEDLSKLLSFEMKFYQSPGRIIDELIKTLKANFGIFIENFLELKKALFIFEIDEFEYSNININKLLSLY